MTDGNPPIGEVVQSPEVQLNPEQKLVQAFLDQYTATFESLSLDLSDDDNILSNYFSKLDAAPFLSPQELSKADILIYQKRSDDADDMRIAKGDHPGVFVRIIVGNKEIQINAWGGLRDINDTVNLKDSRTANLKGGGHAARTDIMLDEPLIVDFQTFVNDDLQDGLKIVLKPDQVKVGFRKMNGKRVPENEGKYTFAQRRGGVQKTSVASISARLMSELKSTVEPMLPFIQGNRNFDPLSNS